MFTYINRPMDLPVSNIVSEIDLKPTDVLLPLYECVVNAIISLKKTPIPDNEKKIQIQIERGALPNELNLWENANTIKSIKVIDNGNGFNSENLESYDTAYSRINKEFGCKGIGRFTVLAAFERIDVESNFYENNKWEKVLFEFDTEKEVSIKNRSDSNVEKRKTVVTLENLKNPELIEASALSIGSIANELMNHLLIYYLSNDLPCIEIYDTLTKEALTVNEKYEKLSKERERTFVIKGYGFNCYITKIERTTNRKNHYLYYCANSRVVGGGKNLSKIHNLFMYPITESGKSFFLDVYLVSEYLNKKVYSSRNGFQIQSERDKGLFDNSITYDDIDNEVVEILSKEYNAFVRETQAKNNKTLQDYIAKEAPQFRRFASRPEILNMIPPNLTDEKKEEYLYKAAYHEKKRIDKNIQEFINKKEINADTIEAIKKELADKTASDVDSLADYMFKRKAIINIFNKFLEADQKGQYKLEEDIHNLIFPMGLTGDKVDYDTHNLWLLDERFATYNFIASDKPITTFSQKKSRLEPDLVMMDSPQMFDNPISFASNPSGELQSMVIFEFKRPGETAHQKSKGDFFWEFSELIEKYFDTFIYGPDKKNFKGASVVVDNDTPKYGYVVVDVIPRQLKEYNKGRGYRQTPFGTLYKIYPELNMHIEVLTFQQLIRAVETRHTPFFDKLFV